MRKKMNSGAEFQVPEETLAKALPRKLHYNDVLIFLMYFVRDLH